MQEILTKFFRHGGANPGALQLDGALRYVFPLLALVILIRCGKSLLMFRREPEVWAWLAGPTGDRIPVMHWESLIGRGKGCDVTLEYPTISRTHAVLTRYDDGSWTIMDAGSTGGVFCERKAAELVCCALWGCAVVRRCGVYARSHHAGAGTHSGGGQNPTRGGAPVADSAASHAFPDACLRAAVRPSAGGRRGDSAGLPGVNCRRMGAFLRSCGWQSAGAST